MVEEIVSATGIQPCTSQEDLRDDLNAALVGLTIASLRPVAASARRRKVARLRKLAIELARELGAGSQPINRRPDRQSTALLATSASVILARIAEDRQKTTPGRKGKHRRESLDQLYDRVQNWSVPELVADLLTLDLIAGRAGNLPTLLKPHARLQWLSGYRLPAIFSANFCRPFGRSTSSSKASFEEEPIRSSPSVGGPGIRFVKACLSSLKIDMKPAAIEQNWKRYRRRQGTSQVKDQR